MYVGAVSFLSQTGDTTGTAPAAPANQTDEPDSAFSMSSVELVQPTVLSQPVFVDGGKFFLQGSNDQWLGLTENGSAALGDYVRISH